MIQPANTFDPKATKEDRVLKHDRQLVCCQFSPDGKHLFAAGFDGLLHRWKLEDDTHATFKSHGGWVESMLVHPDGKRLFTADSWGQVHCWPVAGEKLKPQWTIDAANSTWLRKLAISPDGQQLATCGNDRMVRVFSATDGKPTQELAGHEHCVQSVAFHNDGKSLVSGDQHGFLKHWDISTGKCVRDFRADKLFKVYYQYEQGGVRSMTFDPEFKTLYCAGFEGRNANQADGDPTVVAFDWPSGKQTLVMKPSQAFKGPIMDVAFHPAGYLIGCGSSEGGGVLWFWKPGEAKEFHMVKNATSFRGIGLHPDGQRLAGTAFGDRGGQRGGNGRRLNKEGEYPGFAGHIVLYKPEDKTLAEEAKKS